ncbi:hypothetical protein HH214_01395 [Mucilaginibacter robiniae]|uniref:Uncharacterized protein n=1 Tax=Mucilaginibacter robiniae TaxID=2728022 RepID=A0A7L5DWJ3_9SPHI|nr:hypothetical protein [Mucilaginibacter robiniae]QJD94618.1 hypothetical protein HH214_01395 [Mucilaginibacter robiniae]
MGLFDFLKKKEPQQQTNQQTENAAEQHNEPYLGDLEKTELVYNLVQTPKSERDENWQKAFLQNVIQASFRCGEPQVITGPDGFLYFQLFLPEPNKSFQCYVIDKMKDDFLLSSGFGVVINPTPNSVDWVFSYGDILNLHLNKTFYTTEKTPFSRRVNDETIDKNEKVMIGQPSEAILPQQTRQLLAELLKINGVENPKVLLMMRDKQDGKDSTQDLVFNLTPQTFKTQDEYRSIMQAISWYLPKHYSFVGIDESVFGENFMPL